MTRAVSRVEWTAHGGRESGTRTHTQCESQERTEGTAQRSDYLSLPTRATTPLPSSETPSPHSPPSSMPQQQSLFISSCCTFVTDYPSRGEHAGTVRAEHSLPTIPPWYTFLASGRGVPPSLPCCVNGATPRGVDGFIDFSQHYSPARSIPMCV